MGSGEKEQMMRASSRLLRSGRIALAVCILWTLGACAAPGTERHLAPFFTQLSVAGGDTEIEVAGGAFQARYDRDGGEVNYWAFKPLYSWRKLDEEKSFSWILPPFGTRKVTANERITQILPVTRFAHKTHPDGQTTWSLLTVPGVLWNKTLDGRVVRAWFPFGGVVEHFFSFDRADFVLFPLFARTQRHGRTTHHFLWPFFSVSKGAGGPAWRVWPLAVHNDWEGRYDRRSFLWPLYNYHKNGLSKPEEAQQTGWMAWPFFGLSKRGEARSWTVLWPFFGRTTDPRTGFWAWDGPWPLVVFQGGDPERAERKRVWPFYSYFKGDGLTSRYYLWPFLNFRHEEVPEYVKDTRYFFPVWHGWTRTSKENGLTTTWRKLWPLYRHYHDRENEEVLRAFPSLNPFWRMQFVDEHYAWMWELWTEERKFETYRQRSWLGLWRREVDLDEDRRSLVGIWARRKYIRQGRVTRETSMLFGLIRWRSQPGRGKELLPAAFPGPGWPLQRTPSGLENIESGIPRAPKLP